MGRHYLAILNPYAGQDFPIEQTLADFCKKNHLDVHIHLIRDLKHVEDLIQAVPIDQYTAVIGYGGDGTIIQIATNLIGKHIPYIILPGGTANVLAKELKLPMETHQALQLLTATQSEITYIDAYRCNHQLGLLRINTGILASMITQTPELLKKSLGQTAYTMIGISHAITATISPYHLVIDGLTVLEEGIGMMIANSANIGIPNYRLHPNASITDGLLDVIIIKDQQLHTIKELINMVVNQTPSPYIAHYQGKQIQVKFRTSQSLILDDSPHNSTHLNISILPQAIPIITSTNHAATS